MEAGNRSLCSRIIAATLVFPAIFSVANAADFRTQNFIIMAPSPALAQAVGEAAEAYRRDLSEHWLGRTLPPWPTPCPIQVIAGNLPAQGVTQYNRSPVRDFQMEVVGTPERILDSVLPHEVTHTILATHFGRPLPRWADEGICTTVEHESERDKHEAKLREFLGSRRGIAMNKLFLLTEYPNDVLPMYAQGYSVCQFLIAQRGPSQFVAFLGDYMQKPSWTDNVRRHYGYESLTELQDQWLAWVSVGNGPVERFAKANLSNPSAPNSPNALQLTGNSAVSLVTATPVSLTDSEDGWYVRLRNAATDSPTTTDAFSRTANRQSKTIPPSKYSAAQPQPEQGISSTGATISPYDQGPSRGNPPVHYAIPDRGTYFR